LQSYRLWSKNRLRAGSLPINMVNAFSRSGSALAIAFGLAWPAAAQAQPVRDAARADALFNAGKTLRDAGQYADACPQFAESSRIAPGVGISLYLGDCLEHIGRTASAWTEFRKAEKLANERNDPRVDLARAREAALERRLSGLTIVIPPSVARTAPEVVLDESTPVPPQEWNAPMAVDPGDHVVTVHVPGQAPIRLTAHAHDGDRSTRVSVADQAATPEAVPAPEETPPPVARETQGDSAGTRRWAGVGLLALGAAGISVGTAFILGKNQPSASPGSCSTQPDHTTTEATIAFVAGGAALAAGLVLTVSASGKGSVGVVAAPMLVAGGAGAALRGDF
jgi:hypothetical protein